MKFSEVTGLLADMDGVLWRGNQPLPGLNALFDWLHE
ncbi:MAG: haloacid dehalogenase, partial [Armatimonadetes bacterium]|nr:haloacid dehalogenase [Anaerolineae bacterium]